MKYVRVPQEMIRRERIKLSNKLGVPLRAISLSLMAKILIARGSNKPVSVIINRRRVTIR